MAKRETKSVTITARITPAVHKKLMALAKASKRTKSQTIEIMIDHHVDDDIAFVEAVAEGMRQLDAGKGIPHDEAMRQVRANIAKRKREKRKAA
jgi:predicted transcriptional regulator